MLIPSPNKRLVSLVLAGIVSLIPAVHSQETGAEKEKDSSILLRVICKQPVPGATDLRIVQKEEVIDDLEITDSLMTDPLTVDRGELLLSRVSGGPEELAFEPVLKVTIPNQGKRFVLALFSSPTPTREKPYEYRLIRTDGLRFQSSDLYMFNLTQLPVGGLLGKQKFNLKPGSQKVVTPVPDQAGGRMYQSRFYCQIDEKVRIFNDTRWPLSKTARIYIFFIPDPERQSMGYLSFREYEPFP